MSLRRAFAGPDGNFADHTEFPEPASLKKITLSPFARFERVYYHQALEVSEPLEVRVGGVPWARAAAKDYPGLGEWQLNNKTIVLGSHGMGGKVTAYISELADMEEAYFLVIFDLKISRGHNGAINSHQSFRTEGEAWEYVEQNPPCSPDGRDVGVLVVKGRIAKSVATEPQPQQKDKWFVPKWESTLS